VVPGQQRPAVAGRGELPGRVRNRQLVNERQERDEQLLHRAVGQVDLRLNPGDGNGPEFRRCPNRVIDQGGLARSLAAAEHQHRAEVLPDEFQKLINPGSLSASVQQGPLRTLRPDLESYQGLRRVDPN